MATSKSVWGLDIGQCALKAIKLREVNGQLEAEAFDIVEHPKVLSEPDANREELINQSIEEFLSRNDVAGCRVAVSVPGQSSFTRFVKLPQVDAKRIPQLVGFEAEQQIPFDINEVIWRWQSFSDPDSPDLNVGLFAMKRQDVYRAINPFKAFELNIDLVQMAPLALYNFMAYDRQAADTGATLLVDLGANGTELVVADGPRMWTRTIQLGGNDFTEALVKSFNLSFAKAEKLKRTAASSKYARQVFQAMRPIFADLVQEIQRSIGYYTSLRREARFSRIVGVGNGFRLPGLQKFLEQNLNMPVARADSFNALQPTTTTSAAKFTENLPSFAVAYGLAVQGLELAEVNTNLLPDEIASMRRWRKKRPWFAAAAGLLILGTLAIAGREMSDHKVLSQKSQELTQVESINATFRQLKQEYDKVRGEGEGNVGNVNELLSLTRLNRVWPSIQMLVFNSMAESARHQSLLMPESIDEIKKVDASRRSFITLLSMTGEYVDVPLSPEEAEKALEAKSSKGAETPMSGFVGRGGTGMDGMGGYGAASMGGGSATKDGIIVLLTGRCPLDQGLTTTLLNDLLSRTEARAKSVLGDQVELIADRIVEFDPDISRLTAESSRRGGFSGGAGGGAGGAAAREAFFAGGGLGGGFGTPSTTTGATNADDVDPLLAVNTKKDATGGNVDEYKAFVVGWFFKVVRDPSAAGGADGTGGMY